MAMVLALLALFVMNFAAIWFLSSCIYGRRKRPLREYKHRVIITALLALFFLSIELKAYAVPLAAVKYIFA